ncbi:MAG: hypothetical protein PQJ50_17865 [Spirochaetales bacterium]|nr:hypothetical protein [Spirochaetales bacterium]
MLTDDVLAKTYLHLQRAESSLEEILQWGDFDIQIFCDTEKVRTIDAFIYRFIKLQDIAGQKLFKVYLDEIGDYRDDMSLLDVLDKLEKLGIVRNAEDWMGYRKLRKELTHEYPDNEAEIVEGIKLALRAFKEIKGIINNLENHRNRK